MTNVAKSINQSWEELIKNESFAKATLLAETDSLQSLGDRWGKQWWESRFRVLLTAAYYRATKAGRELTAADILEAHQKDLQDLRGQKDYEAVFREGEELEAAYIIASRKSKPSHILFVTNESIAYLCDGTPGRIPFEDQETIAQVVENSKVEKLSGDTWNWASIVILTNERILELRLDPKNLSHTAIPFEGEEALTAYLNKRELELNEDRTLSECPKCEIKFPAKITHSSEGSKAFRGPKYCSSCGYEFSTGREGVGPFSFGFPAVENAYNPSGKGSTKANIWMLVLGLPTGVIVGGLLYYVHRAIVDFSNNIVGATCFGLLFVWIIPAVLSGFLGYLVAYAVSQGATIGKGRNLNAVAICGVISGLVGSVAYAIVRSINEGPEAFDSSIDIIRVIVYTLPILIVAWAGATETMKRKPFCEACNKYMKTITLGRIPIRSEGGLMEIFKSRTFKDLAALASSNEKDEKNYSTIIVWYCDNCKEQGFINATTLQTRFEYTKDSTKTKSETRLIFSSPLESAEIETLTKEPSKN